VRLPSLLWLPLLLWLLWLLLPLLSIMLPPLLMLPIVEEEDDVRLEAVVLLLLFCGFDTATGIAKRKRIKGTLKKLILKVARDMQK
jgi:hypothetical protein